MYRPLTTEQNWVQLAAGTLSPPQSCTSAGMLMCLQQLGWSVGPKPHPDVGAGLLFPVISCTDSHLHIWIPAVKRTQCNKQYQHTEMHYQCMQLYLESWCSQVCVICFTTVFHTPSAVRTSIVTRLWTGWSKVWSLAEVRDLSLFQTAQNGSGAHLASIQWTI